MRNWLHLSLYILHHSISILQTYILSNRALRHDRLLNLTGMLDNFTHHPPILDKSPDLLREGALLVVVVLGLWWEVDIDAGALAGEKFSVQAVLAEVNRSAVDLV